MTVCWSKLNAWFERNRKVLSKESSCIGLEELIAFVAENTSVRNVLELGCGNGRNLYHLVKRLGVQGFGLDISLGGLNSWSGQIQRIALCCGDIRDLPFTNQSFDLCFFGFSLYMVDEAGLEKSLAEVCRVLQGEHAFVAILDFSAEREITTANIHSAVDGIPRIYKRPYGRLVPKLSGLRLLSQFHYDSVGGLVNSEVDGVYSLSIFSR
jgi:ubiquinone/menaquinone biosynthesis C-methylase UbiE